MEEILNWLSAKWLELSAALGIGGAGALGANKLIDKQQNARLKKLEEEVSKMKVIAFDNQRNIGLLNKDMEANSKNDESFREEMKAQRIEINANIKDMGKKIDNLITYLLNKK